MISTQKQPGYKNSTPLFKMASVKKVVKSKGAAKKWLWWCSNNNSLGEFCADSKLTWIVLLLKILPSTYTKEYYLHLPIPSQPFLGHTLWFHSFFTLAILNRAALFFTARLFLSRFAFTASQYLYLVSVAGTYQSTHCAWVL